METEQPTNETSAATTEVFEEYEAFSYLSDPVYKHVVKAAVSLGLLGVLSNGFVLVVMLGYVKNKSRPSTMLVIHQTVADGMCSANVLVTYTLWFTVDGKLEGWWGEMLCYAFVNEGIFWFGLVVSSFSLVSITFERYLMVVHPILHRNHFNKRLVWILIVLNWFSAAAILAPLPLYYEVQSGWCILLPQAKYINSKAWLICFTVLTFLIPVCILIFGSWKTTHVLFRRTRAIRNQTENQAERLSKGQVNITITMVVVVVVFLVCLLPYQIALAVFTFDIIGYDAQIFGPLFVVCLINCCINPFIYAVKFETFKSGLRKMFRTHKIDADGLSAKTQESTIG